MWILFKLYTCTQIHTEVVNFTCGGPRVFVPDRPNVTAPEPDVAAYRDFPLDADFRSIRWQNESPILVAEVLSADDPNKDLVRNVELYLLTPSIKEYWIIDGRTDENRPTLTVHRRHGKRWRISSFGPADVHDETAPRLRTDHRPAKVTYGPLPEPPSSSASAQGRRHRLSGGRFHHARLPSRGVSPGWVQPGGDRLAQSRASREVAALHGIPTVYNDYEGVLADPAVEVLDVAVPPDAQPALIQAACATRATSAASSPRNPSLSPSPRRAPA